MSERRIFDNGAIGATVLCPIPTMNCSAFFPSAGNTVHDVATATILVVDDEESIVEIMTEGLCRHGYHVLSASDGEEGLVVYRDNQSDIKLVFVDMLMPVRNGQSLILEIRALNSSVQIVACTGLANEQMIAAANAVGANRLLAKPFRMNDMVEIAVAAMAH
jgi:CheY-like chemotaxis protein